MRIPYRLAGLLWLGAIACREQPVPNETRLWAAALTAPGIVQERVSFAAPAGAVTGLLARPASAGPHPAVIIVPGSWIQEPYLAATAAMLAQEGFVAMAVDVFSYFPPVDSYAATDSIPWQVTQRAIEQYSTDARIGDDLVAAWRYLQSQPFTRPEQVAVIGFCGGGRDALVLAAREPDVAAVVAFYAPVRLQLSQRRMLIDVIRDVRAPVQGHYALRDEGIPNENVTELEQLQTALGSQAEIFRYDAAHGFFAYNREEAFSDSAATAAWRRTLSFLRVHMPART